MWEISQISHIVFGFPDIEQDIVDYLKTAYLMTLLMAKYN